MLGRAKRLYTADLSSPSLQDSAGTMLYTAHTHRKARRKKGEGCKDKKQIRNKKEALQDLNPHPVLKMCEKCGGSHTVRKRVWGGEEKGKAYLSLLVCSHVDIQAV